MRAQKFLPIALSLGAMLFGMSLRAQDATSAKAFLVNIYSRYEGGSRGIKFYGPQASRYFHSSLIALEEASLKATGPDYAPAIDWDPICGCQDYDGIWDLAIEIRMKSLKQAEANVSFHVFKDRPAEETKLQITLEKENGGWRIWDILDKSDPKFTSSVRKLLHGDLASLKRNPTPASR